MPKPGHPWVLFAFMLSCSAESTIPEGFENESVFAEQSMVFVRNGVILEGHSGEGQALAGDRRLVTTKWEPGETVQLQDQQAIAPKRPECFPLFHLELGDVSSHISMGGDAPNTGLSWSPSGEKIAIGTYLGEVWVLDGWTGEVLAREQFAETMIKRVAWSPDGQTLYAAEQSPDAMVYALHPDTLAIQWSLRLADRVDTSPAPAGEDIYGVYQLPAAYGLTALGTGDLIVAATHSWREQGVALNKSQLLRISPSGQIQAVWPEEPISATFMHPKIDEANDRISININRSADGPKPESYPIGGIQILQLSDLAPLWNHSVEPLAPYFSYTFIWDAVDIQGDQLLIGLGDGRVRLVDANHGIQLELEPGVPLVAADVPIAASIDGVLIRNNEVLISTIDTLIPYGAAAPELRPPTAHPGSNRVQMNDMNGELLWTWTGPYQLSGMTLSPDENTLVLGTGARNTDRRRDLFGALVFDLEQKELDTFCQTEGPLFFQHALSADGRIAVTEFPSRDDNESVYGEYRLVVFR